MTRSLFILIGWFTCISTCYYIIRRILNKLIRIIFTLFLCILLTYITCQDLPKFNGFSLIIVSVCWLTSIRLIHMTIFLIRPSLTFRTFLLKILWIYFPYLPKNLAKNQWPIIFHLLLIMIKLLINHWIYRWSIQCGTQVSSERIFLFFLSMITISYILDTEMVLVRILTRDKYTLESFTNFPLFSLSLRDFWGRRYNQFVNTVLKESVFEPIRQESLSPTIAGLTTFIISGLLHIHVGLSVFDDPSSSFQAFLFFVIHGIACCFEANMNIQLSEHVAWLLTHAFLLITAPLMFRPFLREDSPFLINNPPPLLNIEWIPKLPLPNFCPP